MRDGSRQFDNFRAYRGMEYTAANMNQLVGGKHFQAPPRTSNSSQRIVVILDPLESMVATTKADILSISRLPVRRIMRNSGQQNFSLTHDGGTNFITCVWDISAIDLQTALYTLPSIPNESLRIVAYSGNWFVQFVDDTVDPSLLTFVNSTEGMVFDWPDYPNGQTIEDVKAASLVANERLTRIGSGTYGIASSFGASGWKFESECRVWVGRSANGDGVKDDNVASDPNNTAVPIP